MGYEIQMSSWGYALARASELGINLRQELSRVPSEKVMDSVTDTYGSRHTSEIHITGKRKEGRGEGGGRENVVAPSHHSHTNTHPLFLSLSLCPPSLSPVQGASC